MAAAAAAAAAAAGRPRAPRGDLTELASAARTDPMALTLLRSAELSRQRREDRLLGEVAELRRQAAALRSRRTDLQRRLDETRPDSRRMDDSFATLSRQTVWRHLGVWGAAASGGGGGRRITARLRPDNAHPAHTLQLDVARRKDAAVTASVRDLPPGVRLDTHLKQLGTASQRQVPALIHAVAAEVDAFSSRRRQVAELRAALPARHSHVWHDPAVSDVSLQLKVGGEGRASRIPIELNMRYAAGAALPHQCRIVEAHRLDAEDREELMQLSETFLRLPLREAFREAFQ